MASMVIIFILLFSGGLFVTFISGQPFGRALPLWLFTIIAVLYIFGILGILSAGVYFIAAMGIVALAIDVILVIKRRIKLSALFTLDVVVFIFFVLLSWWVNRGRMFTQWDEFSHWGLTVKNMYLLNALPNSADSTIFFTKYPPGTALFEYLFVSLPGVYSESAVFRAMNILYFSLTLPLFARLKHKDILNLLLRLALAVTLPLVFFSDFYTTIYVDGTLGLLFAYSLIAFFTYEIGTFSFLNTGLSLLVLTLVKDSGVGLAVIVLIIVTLDIVIFRRVELRAYIIGKKTSGRLLRIIAALCPIILTLAGKYSWGIYLSFKGIAIGAAPAFSRVLPPYASKVTGDFFNALLKTPLSDGILSIPFAGWLLIFLLIGAVYIIFLNDKGKRKRAVFINASVLTFTLVYAAFMLYIYISNFSEYEALNLSSFQRYISTYMLGTLAVLSALVVIRKCEGMRRIIPAVMFIAIFLGVNLAAITKTIVSEPEYAAKTQNIRAVYSNEQIIADTLNPKKDKLYFISAGDKGFDYWVARYNFTPVKMNENFTWSIGKPRFEGDIWTMEISADKWAKELKDGYTYVYIFKSDEAFGSAFGGLFEGGAKSVTNDTLYAVEKTGETVVLRKADIGE